MESSAKQQAAEAEIALQRAEFMAEDELIEISPLARFGVISLICGNFGPFDPQIPTRVR